MGPASLQKDSEPPPPQSEGEMESYRCLLQAGSQLESTLQGEYAGASLLPPLVCTNCTLEPDTSLILSEKQSGCRFSSNGRLMGHFLQILPRLVGAARGIISAVLSRHRWIFQFFIYGDDSQGENDAVELSGKMHVE